VIKSLTNQKLNQVTTRAGLEINRPDSVNIYFDKGKKGLIGKTHYKYDERGNLISMIFRSEFSNGDVYDYEEYYTNFYPKGTANEVISTIQSAVYPNPATEVLIVSIKGAGEALITLVNMNGSTVFQQNTNQEVTMIPLQSVATGYYILTIKASGQITSHKVIKR
jgi:hypothetical protein